MFTIMMSMGEYMTMDSNNLTFGEIKQTSNTYTEETQTQALQTARDRVLAMALEVTGILEMSLSEAMAESPVSQVKVKALTVSLEILEKVAKSLTDLTIFQPMADSLMGAMTEVLAGSEALEEVLVWAMVLNRLS